LNDACRSSPATALERFAIILRQFLHSDPVTISYLFGCGGHAAGAVVDPVGAIRPYPRTAEETGLRLRFVIDTMAAQ
jgi:hydroxyacylglutathione hydrolase